MVYFIQAREEGGPIKIGWTSEIERRFKSIQAHCPLKLCVLGTIPGNIELEKAIHEDLDAHRTHGEWFYPTKRVMSRVAEILESANC